MKKVIILLILINISCFAIFCTDNSDGENVSAYTSSDLAEENVSTDKNVLTSPEKNVSTKSEKNKLPPFNQEIFDKVKMTPKTARNCIIVGGVVSGCGTAFIIVATIMGFIPYGCLPDEMKVYDSYQYGKYFYERVDYPYMTAYSSAGISMVISGALMFLFTMPLLIYGSICLYEYNKVARVTLSAEGVSIKLGKIRNKRSLL